MQLRTLNRIPIDILLARVAQEIRTAILRGDLPPGSCVKQEVHVQPNRGAVVAPVDRRKRPRPPCMRRAALEWFCENGTEEQGVVP